MFLNTVMDYRLVGINYKKILHAECTQKILELHPNLNTFKPHPFCANLAVKWMLVNKIS